MWTILILDRGMVLAGVVRSHSADALMLVVDHCHTVRIWGTVRGVGELALDGPTETTVLDPEGDAVEVSRHYVIRKIPCTAVARKKWTARTR